MLMMEMRVLITVCINLAFQEEGSKLNAKIPLYTTDRNIMPRDDGFCYAAITHVAFVVDHTFNSVE